MKRILYVIFFLISCINIIFAHGQGESKPAGKFEVEFDASKLSSGTYVYKLVAGNYQITKKMQLVK